MQYGFYFDALCCTGCEDCIDACCARRDIPRSLACRTVTSYVGGAWEESADGTSTTMLFAYFLSLSCNECDNPLCMADCPTSALGKDPLTGIVSVKAAHCSGCGTCAEACPYHAPKLDARTGRVVLCDACGSPLSGAKPACVEACPEHALAFGDIDHLRARHGSLACVPPLPEEGRTQPNLVLSVAPAMLASLR